MTDLRAAALLAVILAVYWPSLGGSPLWDDAAHLTSPAMQGLDGLWAIWTQVGATQQYYPITHSAFWAQHHLWGQWWPGYHVTSLALHWVSALLLVAVVRLLRVRGAWLAGALFALHPMMVESVAWMSELKNTLSGALFMGAALAYLRSLESRRRRLYVVAFTLFVAALLAKSVTAVLPLALLLVAWWRHGRIAWRRDVLPLLPFFAVGAASGLFTAWVERVFIGAAGSEFAFTVVERFLIAGRALWFYLGKLVWPAELIFIYPRWRIDTGVAWQYAFPAAFLALSLIAWRLRGRSRAPLAVMLYFAVTLFPALGFLNVYPFRYSFVADHWAYLASVGPVIAAAAWLSRNRALALSTLLALAGLTWRQAHHYTDAETLYRSVVARNPTCWMARQNLGVELYRRGAHGEAETHLLAALDAGHPQPAGVHNDLGLVAMGAGDAAGAERRYRRAVEMDQDQADAWNNLGVLLALTGRTYDAAGAFLGALDARPGDRNAVTNLARLRTQGAPVGSTTHP